MQSDFFVRGIFLFLFLSFLPFSFARVPDITSEQLDVSFFRFTKHYILLNKIKSVRASIMNKADGEIIRDKGLSQVFLFDTSGNLTRYYFNEITSLEKTETEIPPVYKRGKVIKKGYTKVNFQYQYDTLGADFVYTSTGHLLMKRVCRKDFYHTTYYEYFGDGLVSRQTMCKETNAALPGQPFKLGMQTIISDEKFEYEQLTPTQIKKKFLNDEGKVYKTGIINFADKKTINETYEFSVGFVRSEIFYQYDSKGNLLEKHSTDNSSGMHEEKILFEYDEAGNLISEKRFKNKVQTNEIVFVYDEQRKLLISQADRQFQKASIQIIKYEYEFYP